MSLEQRAQISAKLSFPWDEKSVASKHAWVAKNFVDPGTCETCGAGGRLHWASIGHTYTQIRSDWRRLCSRCHQRLDRGSDVALFVRGAIW